MEREATTLAACIVPWEGTGSDEEVGRGHQEENGQRENRTGQKEGLNRQVYSGLSGELHGL